MDGAIGGLILLAIMGIFIWSCNPDNAVWGQNPSKQRKKLQEHYDRLNCMVMPRWHDDDLALMHPDATVVINAAFALGRDWHVILHPWDPNDWDENGPDVDGRILALLYERNWFLACTGEAVRPDGFTPLLATFFNLESTISCPTCLSNMARIYTINHQPAYPRDLYRSQAQLKVSPDLLGWDITKLHPLQARKKKPVKAKEDHYT